MNSYMVVVHCFFHSVSCIANGWTDSVRAATEAGWHIDATSAKDSSCAQLWWHEMNRHLPALCESKKNTRGEVVVWHNDLLNKSDDNLLCYAALKYDIATHPMQRLFVDAPMCNIFKMCNDYKCLSVRSLPSAHVCMCVSLPVSSYKNVWDRVLSVGVTKGLKCVSVSSSLRK